MKKPVLVLAFALAAGGCQKVTSENIQTWKGTQKGPSKLEAALRDSSVPPRLRAEAAAVLIEIDMANEVDLALAATPAAERWEIVKSSIPLYAAGLDDPSVPKVRAARDALFSLRGYAPPEERKQIDALVLPVIEEDLRAGRVSGGRHSLEKILSDIGPAAGPMLVRLIEDPQVPPAAVVEVLARVGDEESRARAGAVLAQRAATLSEIPPAIWRALGLLGGPAAIEFLSAKVEKGFEPEAVAAAQALQQRREPAVLALALKVAADEKANKVVRDEMFGLAEKIGGLEVQRGLVDIISRDPNEMVRYRAFEAVLVVGGGEAVRPALEAFPQTASYKREDVVDFVVKDITKLDLAAARPAVLGALASSSPLARIAAVLSFEAPLPQDASKRLGEPGDAPTLLKLSGDKGTVKGFGPRETVGSEAARVAKVLESGPPSAAGTK